MTRIFRAAREGTLNTRFFLNTNFSNDTNVPRWRGKGREHEIFL